MRGFISLYPCFSLARDALRPDKEVLSEGPLCQHH